MQAARSPAAYRSWKEGRVLTADNRTFAGGFATGKAYETTFAIYKEGLSDFVLLAEGEIYESIAMAIHYTHNMAEGAGASTLKAAFKLRERLKGKKVVLQMSGCNASSEEISSALKCPIMSENGGAC